MLPHLLALALTLTPSLVSAALYPKDSPVKIIDTRGFRNALKENVGGAKWSVMVDSDMK
jgi:protein disulfide-isomerase A6